MSLNFRLLKKINGKYAHFRKKHIYLSFYVFDKGICQNIKWRLTERRWKVSGVCECIYICPTVVSKSIWLALYCRYISKVLRISCFVFGWFVWKMYNSFFPVIILFYGKSDDFHLILKFEKHKIFSFITFTIFNSY